MHSIKLEISKSRGGFSERQLNMKEGIGSLPLSLSASPENIDTVPRPVNSKSFLYADFGVPEYESKCLQVILVQVIENVFVPYLPSRIVCFT